jgi:hypothetical protein
METSFPLWKTTRNTVIQITFVLILPATLKTAIPIEAFRAATNWIIETHLRNRGNREKAN